MESSLVGGCLPYCYWEASVESMFARIPNVSCLMFVHVMLGSRTLHDDDDDVKCKLTRFCLNTFAIEGGFANFSKKLD